MTSTFSGPPDHRDSPQWTISFGAIYIKSNAYVRSYENLDDLRASLTAAFQEVLREMWISTMANFGSG